MLLPTTLPTATSECPRSAAMMLVASSGSDVPTATSVPLGWSLDVPLFRYRFTGAEAVGTYFWIALLTRAGTAVTDRANWVGFDYAAFTFAP